MKKQKEERTMRRKRRYEKTRLHTKVSANCVAIVSSPTDEPRSLDAPITALCRCNEEAGLPENFFVGIGVNDDELEP